MTWRDDAACSVVDDPDIFFPQGGGWKARGAKQRAKEICSGCTVKMQCLEAALAEEAGVIDLELIHGIRGGLDKVERRVLRRGGAA